MHQPPSLQATPPHHLAPEPGIALHRNIPLESLLRNLLIRGRKRSFRIGITKVAATLSVLECRRLCRANADDAELCATSGCAVRVVDTSASDELGTVTQADVAGSGVVGLELG